jgi:hypothetical protein
MNRANRIARVVLAGKQSFGFGGHDFVLEPRHQLAQFVQRSFILFRKFKEHAGVGDFALKLLLSLDRTLDPAALL